MQVLKVTGNLKADEMQATLATGLAGWQEHYEQEQQRGVRLPREVTVTFTLDTAGQVVGEPNPDAFLKNQDLRKRLIETLKGLRFANPGKKPATVTVRLIFPGQ